MNTCMNAGHDISELILRLCLSERTVPSSRQPPPATLHCVICDQSAGFVNTETQQSEYEIGLQRVSEGKILLKIPSCGSKRHSPTEPADLNCVKQASILSKS